MAVIGDRLVGPEADRNAGITQFAERHDTRSKAKIAYRVMCDRASGLRQQGDVLVIDPDRMDHLHMLIENADIACVAHERTAEELVSEHALRLRLEDMADERQ